MIEPLQAELEAALGSGYTVERELTGGGMSHVYVATERALGRKVVVKVLPPDFAAGVNRDRFQREIQLAAQLQHPHIVPLLSAGEHGRLLWYTMPYIDGESLRAQIDRRQRLPVREVVRIITDVAEALAFAHSRGVIHRDIKPGNVLMQGHHALVTDFGVAKALSAALPSGAGTSTGMAIGTPSYMAPEQLASDPGADHRVDLYALGLLAYELLTGTSPFESPSPRETLAAQLTRIPPPLDASNPEVSPALSRIVAQCLQKDPAQRPPTAQSVVDALEDLSSGAVRARSPARRRARVVGLVAVGIGVVATALLFRSDDGARTAIAVSPASAPDTVVVRETVPVQLSREDSLEIAKAVDSRRARSGASNWSRVQVDSLRVELEQAMAESLSRALAQLQRQRVREAPLDAGRRPAGGLPESPGVRTVFIQPGHEKELASRPGKPVAIVFPIQVTGQTDTALLNALAPVRDSLLRVVRGVGSLEVIDLDSLSRMMHQRGTQVAVTLRNSVQVIGIFDTRADSLVLRIDLRPPGWPVRGRTMRLESAPVPRDRPLAAVEMLGSKLNYMLKRAVERE